VRDTGLYFYPHKAWIAAMLRSGHLPLWTASEYGGLPILADPNFNLFHPFTLFTDLLPLPWGFQLFVFAGALLGAYGAYFACRELQVSEAAAVVGAWAFAWSGVFVSSIESGPVLTVASVPWVMGAAIRLRRTGAKRDVLLVAITAALLFFTGVPEIAGTGFILALVLSGRQWRRFLAGCALGAGIAAVQLLPTALFVRESSRGMGFGPEPAFRFTRIPALIFPLFDGWLDAPGAAYWPFDGTPWFEVVYLGVIVALLVIYGAKPQKRVLIAALVFAVCATGPGFAALRVVLPPMRSIRFGDKFISGLAFAAPLVAAAGFDRAQAKRSLLWPALGLAVLAGALVLVAPLLPVDSLGPLRAESLRASALRMVPLSLALGAAALACIAYGRKQWLLPLMLIELGLPAMTLDRTIPAQELVAHSALERQLRDAVRLYRIDAQSAGLRAEEEGSIGEPDWLRTRRLFMVRHEALFDMGAAPDLLLSRGYSGFTPGRMRSFFGHGDLSLLAVKYGVEFGSGGREPYPALGFRPIGARGPFRIFENDRALPRVRLEPADFATPGESHELARGEAHLVGERDDELRIAVDAPQPARLVVADTMAGGWTATIDGAPAKSLPSALRVIEVPAGPHAVVWTYRAPGLFAGAVVTLLSLVALAAIAFI
jgi:hypothetical protein